MQLKRLVLLASGHFWISAVACLLIVLLVAPQVALALDENGHYTPAELQALGIYFVGDKPANTGGDCSGSDATATCCTPAASPTETATVVTGVDNAEKTFNFFVSKGFKPFQAAGIMGNMQAESHIEPRLVEYGWRNSRGEISAPGKPSSLDDNVPPNQGPQGQPGYGLVQWTAPVRKQRLRDRAAAAHVNGGDLGIQLAQVMWELDNTYTFTRDQLKGSTNVKDATLIIETQYERHAGPPNPQRVKFAQDFLTRFGSGGGSTPPSSTDCTQTDEGGSVGSGSTAPYRYPFRDIKPVGRGRIDQGVDYGVEGPVYALSNGIVTYAQSSPSTGWPGGTYIAYLLYDGPAKGKTVYVAENCTLHVQKNQAVNSNTVLCTAHSRPPYIETGWSKPGVPEAMAHDFYHEDKVTHKADATSPGVNFDQLMQKLGAPAGTYDYASQRGHPTGSLPAGWPTW